MIFINKWVNKFSWLNFQLKRCPTKLRQKEKTRISLWKSESREKMRTINCPGIRKKLKVGMRKKDMRISRLKFSRGWMRNRNTHTHIMYLRFFFPHLMSPQCHMIKHVCAELWAHSPLFLALSRPPTRLYQHKYTLRLAIIPERVIFENMPRDISLSRTSLAAIPSCLSRCKWRNITPAYSPSLVSLESNFKEGSAVRLQLRFVLFAAKSTKTLDDGDKDFARKTIAKTLSARASRTANVLLAGKNSYRHYLEADTLSERLTRKLFSSGTIASRFARLRRCYS